MCDTALTKLHQQGCYNLIGLRTIKTENWVRLDLPMAIEDELKKIALKQFEPNGIVNNSNGLPRSDPVQPTRQPSIIHPNPQDLPEHPDPQATKPPALVTSFPTGPTGVHYVGFHPWGQAPSYYTFFPQHTPFANDMAYVSHEDHDHGHPSTTTVQPQEIATETANEEFRSQSLHKDREVKTNGTSTETIHTDSSKSKQTAS